MPGILCDSLLLLRYPVLHHDVELDTSFNTYLASSNIDGHYFAFSVAQPLPEGEHPILPHASVADVHGSLTLYKKSLLFTATTVTGVYIPPAELKRRDTHKLFHPTVSFAGKITRVYAHNIRTPSVKVIDVTVDCGGVWPYEDTVLTCYLNSRDRRFISLPTYQVGMSASVSGELIGWAAGKLAVDVHHLCGNNGGELPERVLSVLPNLFEKLAISNDFAVFADTSTLPPRAGLPASLVGARNASAQWLEIVAGLPTDATADEHVERSGSSASTSSIAAAPTPSTSPVSAAGYVARRAISQRGTRGRRTVAHMSGRSPLSEVDMNVPVERTNTLGTEARMEFSAESAVLTRLYQYGHCIDNLTICC